MKVRTELFEQQLEYAKSVVENINNDPRPAVKYKESRPIVDIRHMLETSVELYADNTVFWEKEKKGEPYKKTTYREMYGMVNSLGTALINMGLKGQKIGIIGANSSRWAISYLAVVCGTGIVVPMDKEISIDTMTEFINRAELSCVITDEKHRESLETIKYGGNKHLKTIITMDGIEKIDENVFQYSKLIDKGQELISQGNREFINAEIDRDTMSILLFTSGTTGASKGVMLSHGNIVEDIMAAPTILKVYPTDVFFSVLPVHHTYECTCGFLMPIYKGASIAYCEGLKYITKNLKEAQPTLFLGVPAIFELLYKKIWQNVRKQGKEKTLKRAIKFNNFIKKLGFDLSKKLFKDILDVFGGKMRLMICGGAAIDPVVLEGINDFGIVALQGYGLTECAPLAALNPDTAPNPSSIGIEFPGIKLAVRDENEEGVGELMVKGPNVMLGYYNMPEETKEALVDGWFRTGDLGYIDDEGYAYITGRKKNVIITKNGENVYPEELEYELNLCPYVLESMVYQGQAEKKDDAVVMASIVVDMENIVEFEGNDLTDEQIEELIADYVEKINEKNPIYKKIRKFNVRKTPLIKNTSNKIIRFSEENK